jgi:hypothetical protein
MKASEILREAVKLPWTKKLLAKNSDNQLVMPLDEKAICFCSVGRIDKAGLCRKSKAYNYLARAIGIESESYIPAWNDAPERTKEQVDAAFLAAAELAEKEGN